MGTTRVTGVIKEPCFGLFRRNSEWQQVKVIACITETGGVVKNRIVCPDGAELTVANNQLKFDGRIKRFLPYPEA